MTNLEEKKRIELLFIFLIHNFPCHITEFPSAYFVFRAPATENDW